MATGNVGIDPEVEAAECAPEASSAEKTEDQLATRSSESDDASDGDGDEDKKMTASGEQDLQEELSDMNISSDYSNISNPEEQASDTESQSENSKTTVEEVPSAGSSSKMQVTGDAASPLSKPEKELSNLCTNMFGKLEDYLKGEVASSVSDYDLLEQMNRMTTYKYQHMLQVATSVGQSMQEINHKFLDLRPYLEQIEQIEESVLALEQAAYKLDSHAKKLEERFRKLERR